MQEAVDNSLLIILQGLCRIVIGVQLVIAGFQLPAKYPQARWKEMAICLLTVITVMWIYTSLCILVTIPKLSLLAALVIGSCVTCIDPILSQAVARGPFAGKFVPRALREIISSEAGANDGFGFPFLFVSLYKLVVLNLRSDHPQVGHVSHSPCRFRLRQFQ
jgi:NhaP-type Na+/H+ or K+/H+ antiporter